MAMVSRCDCDVIIIGLGPVGAVTANLLGNYGLEVKVFERDLEVYNLGPRAVAIDAEATRVFGMIGLDGWLDNHVNKSPRIGIRTDVPPFGTPLISIKPDNHRRYGYQGVALFNQPRVERILRDNLKRYNNVRVYLGFEVIDDSSKDSHVVVTVRRLSDNKTHNYTCKYLLVCEGGRSATRKRHGLQFVGSSFKQQWLVLDTVTFDKELKTSLKDLWFVTNRNNNIAIVSLPDDTLRFEILLNDDALANDVVEVNETANLIQNLGIDSNKLYFKRRIVYTFHARQIQHWYDDKVVFLGDAAHCMPPFAGQGLCNGIRDAGNLAWKVAFAIRGTLCFENMRLIGNHTSNGVDKMQQIKVSNKQLLQSFERERCDDVKNMTIRSINIGRFLTPRNPIILTLRNLLLLLIHFLGFSSKLIVKPVLQLKSGLFDDTCDGAGELFIQPNVLTSSSKTPLLLDKVLGIGFSLIYYNKFPDFSNRIQTKILNPLNATVFQVLPPKNMFSQHSIDDSYCIGTRIIKVVDVDKELHKWFRSKKCDVVVLRPDRFIYGYCSDNNLPIMLEKLCLMLTGKTTLGNLSRNRSRRRTLTIVVICCIVVTCFITLFLMGGFSSFESTIVF